MAHELWHVYSRLNPKNKDKFYNAIGFYNVGEVEYPTQYKDLKISNPDCPVVDYAIKVNVKGKE